jgi:hypothetical protein
MNFLRQIRVIMHQYWGKFMMVRFMPPQQVVVHAIVQNVIDAVVIVLAPDVVMRAIKLTRFGK